MADILDRKEWDDDGSLALDLSCGCIIVVPNARLAHRTIRHFDCPKHDKEQPL